MCGVHVIREIDVDASVSLVLEAPRYGHQRPVRMPEDFQPMVVFVPDIPSEHARLTT
jgi:hypothetical protein